MTDALTLNSATGHSNLGRSTMGAGEIESPGHIEPTGEIEFEVRGAAATPRSFSELYLTEFPGLVRLATLLTGRTDTARDVVQDAFVRLHLKWGSVRDPGAYVRRSVVNGSRSHHRRAAREASRSGLLANGVDTTAALDVDHTLATLAALNHRERAIVVLKFYEQRSEAEIATLVGCRPGSVGPTLQRALAKLRALQG